MIAPTPRWRALATVAVTAAGFAIVAGTFNAQDPIGRWLVWRYAGITAIALAWGACCLTGGWQIARRLGLKAAPPRELLVYSLALGVLAFALLTVLVGLAHGLGTVSFVLMPLLMLASGGRAFARYLWRYVRRVRRLRFELSWLGALAALYGCACCVALYLNLLSPSHLSYDARWYHLPIAEHYAASGAIARFDEGWYPGALPHFASWLYTWVFTLPGGLWGRIELAMHLEYVLLLATLLSVPVLLGVVLRRPRVRGAWAGLFLFPGIFVYDSGLSGGADHVLAFFTVPVFLALLRCWRRPTPATATLLAALISAAALTKYQAITVVLVPMIAIALFARRSPRAAGAAVLAGLVLTAPHWLLNLVWYRNPIYPLGFGGNPFLPGLANVPALADRGFYPEGSFFERVRQTVGGVASFGFVAHDWSTFHGARPVFGALFLPCLALLPFIKPKRAVWALAASGLAGAVAWFWTYHQDRYLQALAPLLAVVVLAALNGAWRQSRLVRPALAALVALQLLACADIYFLPTHAMAGGAPIAKSIELITSGHRKAYAERDQTYTDLGALDAVLPRDAKVLVHETHLHLGLNRPAVRDAPNRQGGISYAQWGDPATILGELKKLGVTHVLYAGGPAGSMTAADDAAFFHFAQVALKPQANAGGMHLAPLPAAVAVSNPAIAVLSCSARQRTSREIEAQWEQLRGAACDAPASAEDVTKALAGVDLAFVDTRRFPAALPELTGFSLLLTRNEFQILGRKPVTP